MRTSLRWLVPVSVVAVVAGGTAINAVAAGNAAQLPTRTPQQLIEAIATARVTALSGSVGSRIDLGLPALGEFAAKAAGASDDPQGVAARLLTGKNTVQVWADGPTRQRAQLADPSGDLTVVRNGDDVWTYSAKDNTASHGTLGKDAAHGPASITSAPVPTGAAELTPAQIADRILTALDPTTQVTVGDTETVADRATYPLTLTPKTSETLVDHVAIAVDGEKNVPLRVQVFARGKNEPAIEVGFTTVTFATPATTQFSFTPPAGAKVEQLGTLGHDDKPDASSSSSSSSSSSAPASSSGVPADHPKPIVTGTGWSTIVQFPAGSVPTPSDLAGSSDRPNGGPFGKMRPGPGNSAEVTPSASGTAPAMDPTALLDQFSTPVDGGRAIKSSLVSVLLTNDGRVFLGSVPVQSLVDAAKK